MARSSTQFKVRVCRTLRFSADRASAFRGFVSPAKSGDMYFHGCPPGACAGILRIGFQSSGDMRGFTKAELQEIHEWHDRGGKGVYTAPTSGLANVLETYATPVCFVEESASPWNMPSAEWSSLCSPRTQKRCAFPTPTSTSSSPRI